MELSTALDWLMLASIAICIAVWPTQVISATQNRWLRIVTIAVALVQVLLAGPRLEFLPAYGVIAIFIVRLLPKGGKAEPVIALSAWQWAVVGAAAAALLLSVVLNLVFPR